VEFDAQDRFPNVLGEFVWTGFDYLGEPTPFGGRDGKGVWTKEPMVHILPHWNWAGREGQAIPVLACTNGDQVELLLNGRSLGRKARGAEPVEIPVGPNVSQSLKFSTITG